MAPAIVKTQSLSNGFKKPIASPRRAYVTFLAGDGDYVKGVVGLAKGLRKAGSAYPLVVAVLADVPESHREMLTSQGCIIREVEPIYPPEGATEKFARAYYAINYCKLRIWEFVEYTKMVYLDSDIQVFENMDELFDLPDGNFYAVMDCCKEKTWTMSPEFDVNYCRQQRPEQTPKPKGRQPAYLYFNAGMFVYEPSMVTLDRMLAAVETMTPTAFAEQDFLNVFFKDVFKQIPLDYSFLIANLWLHPEQVEFEKIKAVHYCAPGSKPWKFNAKEEQMDREDVKLLLKRWWDIYSDETLDKKPEMAVMDDVMDDVMATVEIKPAARLQKALSEAAGVYRYMTTPSTA